MQFLYVHVNVDIRKNLLDPKIYVAFDLAITYLHHFRSYDPGYLGLNSNIGASLDP
jgi:hypothetical protein